MSVSEKFEEMFRRRFGRQPKKEELATLIDQSVKSYNQSGGITAHTVNLGPQARRLNAALKKQILSEIRKDKSIVVTAILGDGEAIQFATEIHAFLKANGFELAENGISQSVFAGKCTGLTFDPDSSTFIVGTNLA